MPNQHSGDIDSQIPGEETLTPHTNDDLPSADLLHLAQRLRAEHVLAGPDDKPAASFFDEIREQQQDLQQLYDELTGNLERDFIYSQAAEWLLDNYYVVQQALRQVNENLPRSYYDEMPALLEPGPLHRMPRIYDLAKSLVTHEQFHLDIERTKYYLGVYQERLPLTIGEIWAFPIWLRYALIESMLQVASQMIRGRNFSRENPGKAAVDAIADHDAAEVISACIRSLRMIAGESWNDFFEDVSLVEATLREDPSRVYEQMTFRTRDRYRKVVEKLAQLSGQAELEVAQKALALAQAGPSHIGQYLVGNERIVLQQKLAFRMPIARRLRSWLAQHPTLLYLGAIILFAVILLLLIFSFALAQGARGWMLVLILVLTLIPVSATVVGLVNWLLTKLSKPRLLAKMEFSDGIPEAYRTMVVIPCLLTSEGEVESLLRQLEQHYLRNPDAQLGFALLSDFVDAQQESLDADAALLSRARQGITELNERHHARPFFLFHRRRLWNPSEGLWMGWERKRGKLHEFNRLLRGASDTTYIVQEGKTYWLRSVYAVITLDVDTVLPLGAANRLVGTLAHPLNVARFAGESGRVVSGYTILQPRTEIQPVSANQSRFTRIFAGDAGMDLYTLAVSDVYQDLFGEGSYTGKGIYHVDSFERSIDGRIPENSLLSHDLFEGLLGRAGLVTDIVLYEDYPPHFLTYLRRSHRWIRGDWQLLPWLFPRTPDASGTRRNELKLIHLWKIVDNLRRSLQAPALFFYFVAAWLFFPGSLVGWTLLGLLLSASSVLSTLGTAIIEKAKGAGWSETFQPVQYNALRWLLHIAFLPFETILVIDAVALTLWRLLVSRRHLLQWITTANTTRLIGSELRSESTIKHSLPAIVLSLSTLILILLINPSASAVAAPLVITWLLSFFLAQWINQPEVGDQVPLSSKEQRELRKLARATWLFFEQYVTPSEHWLPPDHFQESPRGIVAHRTSPTNIGLYLVSALAARDLGYISTNTLAVRLGDTFESLEAMDRYRGHFLNWIDTSSLTPLAPKYISTVDSGNLAGCLLALKEGCAGIVHKAVWNEQRWSGQTDLLDLFVDYLAQTGGNGTELVAALEEIKIELEGGRSNPLEWHRLVTRLTTLSLPNLEEQLLSLMQQQPHTPPEILHNWRLYVERLGRSFQEMERELTTTMPWLVVWPPPFAADSDNEVQQATQHLAEVLMISGSEISVPTLAQLPHICRQALLELEKIAVVLDDDQDAISWCSSLSEQLQGSMDAAATLLAELKKLSDKAYQIALGMDFSFLYDRQREVFRIGYNLDSENLDNNYYDLLASEARIASLFAIAKRDVPARHWLHLARPLAQVNGDITLLSWSGTMFEYLMPLLFMRNFRGTLLHHSCRVAVERQISYGREQQKPWGISESGYYAFDSAQNYQYRAFGVPGLGYKRGLADDYVVAPYASIMALAYQPKAVVENLLELKAIGMLGFFGLYEAVDYTPGRVPLEADRARVLSYMSHHQGMIMIALTNRLLANRMVDYFHDNPLIQSVDLLLQEQVPPKPPIEEPQADEMMPETRPAVSRLDVDPWSVPEDADTPLVHWLSNGKLHTLITNSGGGQISTNDFTITRWRPDRTQDDWGTWIYVQETGTDRLWSAGLQPAGKRADEYEVQFYPHMASFHRRDYGLSLLTEVVVAPDEMVEIRRVTLTNHTAKWRRLRLTSFAEVVLADADADLRHQAFVKLFVESEFAPELNGLFFRRRPRRIDETPIFLAHLLVAGEGTEPSGNFESDRRAFLGRGNSIHNPAAMRSSRWLTGTVGATLDPIMSLGQDMEISPYEAVKLAFITVTADTRPELIDLCRRHQRWTVLDAAFEGARHQAEKELQRLDLPTPELAQVQRLLSQLLYPSAGLRADTDVLAKNQLGQPALWAHGISGDHPILLAKIRDEEDHALVEQLLRAHIYWRRRGLKIALVILNQQDTNYGQPLDGFIRRLIQRQKSSQWLNKRGGIFLLRQDQLDGPAVALLLTTARVVLDCAAGPLSAQLEAGAPRPTPLPHFLPAGERPPESETAAGSQRPEKLRFDNGYGGFDPSNDEYVIHLQQGSPLPAPWINVIANEDFGFTVSETGGGFSWSLNSGENRLTTFRNDPVTDMPAEAIYIRDEETAAVWSPLPLPSPDPSPYTVRHGAGYSQFEHISHALEQETCLFAPAVESVKIVRLSVANRSERTRRLTVTYYAEWVLGSNRATMQAFVQPWYVPDVHALMAKNPYNVDFGERVAFLAADRKPHGYTSDRTAFIGQRGSLQQPDALSRVGLDDQIRPGLDPCGAIQVHLVLEPGAEDDVVFLLGQGKNEEEALQIIAAYQEPDAITRALANTRRSWKTILEKVQVETPDEAFNLLLNRWLLYQALACRIWGRSALYQSSGAFGFRDQLQDVMALLHTRPDLTRAHILRAARHQFEAGDVLHWWHPPGARGVRTRITDDLVWLPFVTIEYVRATGDMSILQEQVPYLVGKPLSDEEEERYGLYESTEAQYTLFDHCCRALRKASTQGRHGLPLMGAGDWNDGMNRVGHQGRGESVWLGWFLYGTLDGFAELCEQIEERQNAGMYREWAEAYRKAIEEHAWDGSWYRRAYYDDGTPLGSAVNSECQIDSLPQSWGVLTGGADPERAGQAMACVKEMLVKEQERLMLLFTPPFDETVKDPGYIKGYPPGIRENGGQYTHAALWAIWAFADAGDAETAYSLFELINPIRRADTSEKARLYEVEPYVISADVYGVPPHEGTGGWTWYTGSSGWMYRLGLEGILGLHRRGDRVQIRPCIPRSWPSYRLLYCWKSSTLDIKVRRQAHTESNNVQKIHFDGETLQGLDIPLMDDGQRHEVVVILGEAS